MQSQHISKGRHLEQRRFGIELPVAGQINDPQKAHGYQRHGVTAVRLSGIGIIIAATQGLRQLLYSVWPTAVKPVPIDNLLPQQFDDLQAEPAEQTAQQDHGGSSAAPQEGALEQRQQHGKHQHPEGHGLQAPAVFSQPLVADAPHPETVAAQAPDQHAGKGAEIGGQEHQVAEDQQLMPAVGDQQVAGGGGAGHAEVGQGNQHQGTSQGHPFEVEIRQDPVPMATQPADQAGQHIKQPRSHQHEFQTGRYPGEVGQCNAKILIQH